MLKSWLKLFRVVNLPTVPGDVLVGAAALSPVVSGFCPSLVAWAAGISVLIYMFGLVDNDIVGAKTDVGRPIPDGELSIGAARLARGFCLLSAAGLAVLAEMPAHWWLEAVSLVAVIVAYNRTKSVVIMGCCRGMNIGCGTAVTWYAADAALIDWRILLPFAIAGLVTLYFAAVTKYSEGEEKDPARKRRVGVLIGAHVYFQLAVLIVFALLEPHTMPLLVAGAVLLVVLRIFKQVLPGVSAS